MFSIIIPTFNNLDYLKLCLKSLKKNSNFEHEILIFINDGSDGSLDYVKKNKIKFLHSIKNLDLKFNVKDLLGIKYLVNFQTNEKGSRFYGNEKDSEIKILAIGDSMTNGPYTSNDETWFSYFARKLEIKSNKKVYVEAIGSAGHGNFQQYLLAKEILENYNPDFVILQLCSTNASSKPSSSPN